MDTITPYTDRLHRNAVIDLWNAVFDHPNGHRDPALSIDKKRLTDDGLFFVALAGNQVVGTVMAGYDGHRGWLYSVAVAPTHRGHGTGTALVSHAEQALLARGCMKINLQVVGSNAGVTAFYESLGFCIEPHISMGKRLPSNIG